jgi:hypothetical protein
VKISIEEKNRHQHCYALLSRDDDPAARLTIHVSGENVAGEKFMGWIYCRGEKVVMAVNTLVDRLEGNPRQCSVLQPRRRIKFGREGRRVAHFT